MAISASKIYYCINKNSLKDALLFKKVISNRTCIILVFKLIVLLINIIFEEHYFRGIGWHAGWTLGPSVTNYRQIATRQIYYYYCYNIPGTSVCAPVPSQTTFRTFWTSEFGWPKLPNVVLLGWTSLAIVVVPPRRRILFSASDPSLEDHTGDFPLEHCFLLYTTFFCMPLFTLETRVDRCACANSN